MTRLILGLMILGLLVFVAYYNFQKEPLDSTETIEAGLQQLKDAGELGEEEEQLLRVQLAVSDYMASNGRPPESLDELVPRYFSEVPIDPRSGKPYEYSAANGIPRFGLEPGKHQVASKKKDDEESQGEAFDSAPEGFINPNTMVLSDFTYDPRDKRDPFLPFDFAPKALVMGEGSPLEQYSLGQLRLTAVLVDSEGGMKGIVEDSEGKGYTVRAGTKIGNAGGVVVSVEEDHLNIVESHVDFTGEEVRRAVEIKIHRRAVSSKKSKGSSRKSR